jgi:Domain of unknown function (DUF397)
MCESTASVSAPGKARVWHRASKCQDGECVEVLALDEVVMLRDSARPEAVLSVAAASWSSFTDAVRAGEFDHLD